MIDCFGKHKLENRKGQSLEEVYNEAIKGRDESEHRAIANKVALDFHKELFNEMEVLKKQVKGQSFKPSKYESPDKSDVVKKITDEYNEKINALEKEVTQDTNTPTTTGKEQPLVTDPTSKGEGAKGKFEEKARRLAEKIMNTDIVPDWLKIDDANVDTKGASAEQVKKALADATIKMGKLLDKGVEFKDAVKEAVNDLVDLMGEGMRGKIEDGFAKDYKNETNYELSGITQAANEVRRIETSLPEYQRSPESFEQWNNEAEKLLKNGYDVEGLMNRIEKDNHNPTPVENAIRKIYYATIDAEVAKNPTNKLLAIQKRNAQVGDLANSRAGQNLVSLKGQNSPLSSISDFYVAKMEAIGADVLTDAQKAEVKKQYDHVQETNQDAANKIKLLEEENAKKAAKAPDKVKLTKWVQDINESVLIPVMSTTESGAIANDIYAKFQSFIKWANSQIETL